MRWLDTLMRRSLLGNSGPDGRGPICLLVPRQQIASEAKAEHQQEKDDPSSPRGLARKLVRARQEGAEHVQRHRYHHRAGAPDVEAADECANARLL